MKGKNLWLRSLWSLWIIYVSVLFAFLYHLRNNINNKDIAINFGLAIIFFFLNVYIIKERKRTTNFEIKTNIQQFKDNTGSMIGFVLLFIGFNFFFNAHHEKEFWLYLVSISAYIIWLWVFTYDIGFVILAKINPKRESIFFGKFIELMFECATNLTVIILLVSYAFSNDFSISLERIIKTVLPLLALIIPVIKIYNFIISEYYEYEKEKPVNTIVNEPRVVKKEMSIKSVERRQYRFVRYFVKHFVNKVKTIEDLDNLEKIIAEQRSELEKKQYKVFKYFVNNDATIEDLDNLEKIIAAQRSELENNNDVEKHMD